MELKGSLRDLRNALGNFATGVTVVTTVDKNGALAGLTANSFSSVSLDPPLVSWCIGRDSTRYDIFSQAEHFAIHVLGEDQQALSNLFASPSGADFAQVNWQEGLQGVPLLAGVETIFQCRLEHCYEGGDHLILVGRVIDYRHGPIKPLVFFEGGYKEIKK